MSDPLSTAREKLDTAVRNDWIDRVILTGDEARALAAALAAQVQAPAGEDAP